MIPDLLKYVLEHFVFGPRWFCAAYGKNIVAKHRYALYRMRHFRVELEPVQTAVLVSHRSYRAIICRANCRKPRGKLSDRVAVAHPYMLVIRNFFKNCRGRYMQLCDTVFAYRAAFYVSSEHVCHELVPVAQA